MSLLNYDLIILANSLLFGQNGYRKTDSDKKLKIVEKDQQSVYKVHQDDCWGFFINLGLPGGSFWQKVLF